VDSNVCRPCLDCGELAEGSRCDECAAARARLVERSRIRLSDKERGYDYAWRKLSARARRLQTYCDECGSTDDLTADHLPIAWERKAEGKPIRLEDVRVLCRSCNSSAGPARPGSERAGDAA
jgi:5-methylcytosine-specific restriction endonuclease McrA